MCTLSHFIYLSDDKAIWKQNSFLDRMTTTGDSKKSENVGGKKLGRSARALFPADPNIKNGDISLQLRTAGNIMPKCLLLIKKN